jgi:putative FmdB family regulatory protein
MPIYEYTCRSCGHEFEAFFRGSAAVVRTTACPSCSSPEVERLLSLPAINSDTTRARIRKETTRRDHLQATDRANEQRKYELSHED